MSKTKAVSQNQAGGNWYKDRPPQNHILYAQHVSTSNSETMGAKTPERPPYRYTEGAHNCWLLHFSPLLLFLQLVMVVTKEKMQRGHRSYANNRPKHLHHFVRVSSFGHRREIQPDEQTIADICSQHSRIGAKTQEASLPQCWLKGLSALYPQPHAGRRARHVRVSNTCVSIKSISRNCVLLRFCRASLYVCC